MKITVDISECLSSTQEIEVPDDFDYDEIKLLEYVNEQIMLPCFNNWFIDDFTVICNEKSGS